MGERPRAMADHSPLPFDPSIRGPIFWILNSLILNSTPLIAAPPPRLDDDYVITENAVRFGVFHFKYAMTASTRERTCNFA